MSNDYFNLTTVVTRLTAARASAINAFSAAVKAGFDRLPTQAALATDKVTYAPDTGTANAVQMSLPLVTEYSEGLNLRFKVAATNTGATTVQVNALGARAIRRSSGDNLNAGDLVAGAIHEVAYNGTFFELLTAVQSDVNEANLSAQAAAASALDAANSAGDAEDSATAAASSASSAASTLASAIGSTVQAYDADLTAIAALSFTNNEVPIYHTDDWQKFTVSGYARSVLVATDAATARTTLGVNDGLQWIATADASTSAALDFTLDATKYDGYVIVFGNMRPATDGSFLLLRTSSDGGANFDAGSTDYDRVYTGRTTTGTAVTNESIGASGIVVSGGVGNDTEEDGVSGRIVIAHPHLARRTNVTFEAFGRNSSGAGEFVSGAGSRAASAAVDAIRLLFTAGNIATGSATIYGYRNA